MNLRTFLYGARFYVFGKFIRLPFFEVLFKQSAVSRRRFPRVAVNDVILNRLVDQSFFEQGLRRAPGDFQVARGFTEEKNRFPGCRLRERSIEEMVRSAPSMFCKRDCRTS